MQWLVILFILAGGSVYAQQGPILTGAHPGFTRITMPLSGDIDWTMGRTSEGYGVKFETDVDFDLSGVYRRIDRRRLSAIELTGNMLSLSVGCNCRASAFRYRDSYLVVDIQDGAPNLDSQFESVLQVPADVFLSQADVASEPSRPGRMLLPLAPGTVPVPVTTIGLQANRKLYTRPSPAPTNENMTSLVGLERDVVDTFARAASQGLLELAPDYQDVVDIGANPTSGVAGDTDLEPQIEEVEPPVSTRVEVDSVSREHEIPTAEQGTPGLLAHTSLDTLQAALDVARGATGEGGLCWPASFTDLSPDNDTSKDFGTVMGALRAAVTDDRDRADADAVADLARGYISFGFGQEAIQSLEIDGVTDRVRFALRAMAEVVDGLPQSSADLARQIGCPGSPALWGLLAAGQQDDAAKSDTDQIVRQFRLLPEALQISLGSRLADILRLGGRADLAELVLAPAQRIEVPPLEVVIAETELALHRGNIVTATENLSDLAKVDPRMTPEALVQLVDLQLSQGIPIAPETLSLLETMQFQFRDQAVASDLMRVRVEALAKVGSFDTALTFLADAEAILPDADGLALRSVVIQEIVDKGEDMLFLDVAFRPLGRDVMPDVQNRVAVRLLDLGFPDRALSVIDSTAIGSVMAERRYLKAMAAMETGDVDGAALQLSGVSTPRAMAILGLESVTGVEEKNAENDEAWRSGDWATLASSDDTLLQEAAALAQGSVSPVPNEQTPLANSRALIEDATRTRATIDTLMSRFAPPS